ncbi:F-box/kelch-repeat protein At3g06240-like [Papaver somniferum]|uniref:F-box/kelch-repeat protein At3g06240-like n=1 Tax=Papaver somniferum TaxID=3469 RepID=UPI000E7044CB|nr:F-box/kelch-repeat protein At3g06240-like [Papaver somniferum]
MHGWGISVIGYDSLSSSKELHEFDDAVNKEHPFETDHVQLFRGHCNGLIYFRGSGRRNMMRFCVWNPATKEYKIIPKSPTKYMRYGVDLCGFGYDCKIDDYKLCSTNGVLVNGALNWLCMKRGKDTELIISFDISDEKFKEMQPPKEVSENKELLTTVGTLEGLLCVLVEVVNVQFRVWVMQDYGVQESWTKRFVVTHEKFMKYPSNVFHLCSLDKGKIILFSDGDTLVLYDPKHEYARKISMEPDLGGWIWNSVNYFESLVSVNSGRYVGENQEDSDDSDSDSDLVIKSLI